MTGVDGKKLGAIQNKVVTARTILEAGKVDDLDTEQLAKFSDEDRKKAEKEHAEKLELLKKLKEAGVYKEGGGGNPKDAVAVVYAGKRRRSSTRASRATGGR